VPAIGEFGEFREVPGLGGQLGEEIAHRAAQAGVEEVGVQIAHRHHHESTLVHARVRDVQPGFVGDQITVHEQVEIEGTGTPVLDTTALAAGLDPVEKGEQLGGGEGGITWTRSPETEEVRVTIRSGVTAEEAAAVAETIRSSVTRE